MALYRKYRPATFAQVIGQEHVTEPISVALTHGRINHAYLFSGPRGCGKTSSARILARSLNCVQGPTPTPCGQCDSCVSLAPGGHGNLDVTELDAASHGGVDDTRELRERAFFAPASSRYRILIIDEAHMVTNAGFNALLKIVEEPPEHLIFIFATTEPEKVLPTIRSRTHHYPFRLLVPSAMKSLVAGVCQAENVSVDEDVFPLVIKAGGGSPRDTLSVLDQLLAGAQNAHLTYHQAAALLGATEASLLDDAVFAIAENSGTDIFHVVQQVIEAGHDPRRFASDLLHRFRDLIIVHSVSDALSSGLVDVPDDQAEQLMQQSKSMGLATLSRVAEELNTGLASMRGATSPRLLLEIVCAKLLIPHTQDSTEALVQRIEALERGTSAPAASQSSDSPSASASESGGYIRPSQRQSAEASAAHAVSTPVASPPQQEQPAPAPAEDADARIVPDARPLVDTASPQPVSQDAGPLVNYEQHTPEPSALDHLDPQEKINHLRSLTDAVTAQDHDIAASAGASPVAQQPAVDHPAVDHQVGKQHEVAAQSHTVPQHQNPQYPPKASGHATPSQEPYNTASAQQVPSQQQPVQERPAGYHAAPQPQDYGQQATPEQENHQHQAAPQPQDYGQPRPQQAPQQQQYTEQHPQQQYEQHTQPAPDPQQPAPVHKPVEQEIAPAPNTSVISTEEVSKKWQQVREFVGGRSKTIEVMLANTTVVSVEGTELLIQHELAPLAQRLSTEQNAAMLSEAMSHVFGGNWTVHCRAQGTDPAAQPQSTPPPRERRSAAVQPPQQQSRPAPQQQASTPQRPRQPRSHMQPPADYPPPPEEPLPEQSEEDMYREALESETSGDTRRAEEIAEEILVNMCGAVRIDKPAET